MSDKQDYSKICTMDDDHDKHCWNCTKFVFPIGCMVGEEEKIEKERNVKVIVINGNGGVGKDKFIELCQELYCNSKYNIGINQISTVDFVKEVAKFCSWSGTKTPQDRKFLSDIKDALEEWDNVPNKKVEEYIEHLSDYDEPQILFIHAREPHNIQYYKDKYNAITVLMVNDRIEQVTSNHADFEVYDFTYDYIIDNNGDLEQLKSSAKTFMAMTGLILPF